MTMRQEKTKMKHEMKQLPLEREPRAFFDNRTALDVQALASDFEKRQSDEDGSIVAQIERVLKQRNAEMESLLEHIPGGVCCCKCDRELTFIAFNSGFLSLIGYTKEELSAMFQNQLLPLIHPEDRERVMCDAKEQSQRGDLIELEYRMIRRDGVACRILERRKRIAAGVSAVFYALLIDITQRKQEQEELRLSLERHRIIMNQTTDIIFEWNLQEDTLEFSENWLKKFGYVPLRKQVSRAIFSSKYIHPLDIPSFYEKMQEIFQGQMYAEMEFRIKNAKNLYIWCRIRATTQFDDQGKPIKAVGVITDIEAEKRLQQKLQAQAQQDELTGLYNKSATAQAIEAQLKLQKSDVGHVLMIIDLDNFKMVNDRFGHVCGDAVLTDAARILRRSFRSSDIIGRIGGDEFMIFLPCMCQKEQIAAKARKLIKAFQQLSIGKDNEKLLSCSVGAACYPDDAITYEGLYRRADIALYYVKHSGKADFAFFHPEQEGGAAFGQEIPSSVGGMREDAKMGQNVDQALVQYVFQLLYEAVEVETAIHYILKLVGTAYDVSRVYVFENSADGRICSNTFEWCSDGVAEEKENLQNISYATLGDFLEQFDEKGIFYCQDIRNLHPQLYAEFRRRGAVSVLQYAILDSGEFKGFVGFDECRNLRYWTEKQVNSLALVARVLSAFLLKLRLRESLRKLTRGKG